MLLASALAVVMLDFIFLPKGFASRSELHRSPQMHIKHKTNVIAATAMLPHYSTSGNRVRVETAVLAGILPHFVQTIVFVSSLAFRLGNQFSRNDVLGPRAPILSKSCGNAKSNAIGLSFHTLPLCFQLSA